MAHDAHEHRPKAAQTALPTLEKQAIAAAKEKTALSTKQVSELVLQNRANIARFKELGAKIKLEKKRRDELNAKTNELRKKRRELIDKIKTARAELDKAVAELSEVPGSRSEEALKAQIESMEWTLQTEDLNAKEEKALSKKIRELEKQLPYAKRTGELHRAIAEKRKALREAAEPLGAIDRELYPSATEANAHHEKMLAYYKDADQLSKSIQYTFTKLDMARMELDSDRKHFSDEAGRLRDKERSERDQVRRELDAQKRVEKEKITEAARAVYDKFKGGKKISTDEFRILQESGLL
jgi:uncharacterized coiled-coil DUF342 family protein